MISFSNRFIKLRNFSYFYFRLSFRCSDSRSYNHPVCTMYVSHFLHQVKAVSSNLIWRAVNVNIRRARCQQLPYPEQVSFQCKIRIWRFPRASLLTSKSRHTYAGISERCRKCKGDKRDRLNTHHAPVQMSAHKIADCATQRLPQMNTRLSVAQPSPRHGHVLNETQGCACAGFMQNLILTVLHRCDVGLGCKFRFFSLSIS